jgi:sulfite reductase (NADPH) hemoprotein beta-component
MYSYTDFDRRLVHERAAQYRDQLERHLAGELSADDFRPLRLQNGWYLQRHAPMLRVAVPYGVISSAQLRALARIATEFDVPPGGAPGFGHLTTRQNVQFNWIPLERSAAVMDALAAVDMHGIQTSGNCIRNITTDVLAGVAADEIEDPRPYAEILRQWSTLHPEFAFLPRKFKIAISGAREDRAAIGWHDIGLQLLKGEAGEVGFAVYAGGGMGRTPVVAPLLHGFVPWAQILVFIEAIVRTYNRFGRRDNLYKARLKILVRAEGQAFVDAVAQEFEALLAGGRFGAAHLVPEAELARVKAHFTDPVRAQPKLYEEAAQAWPDAPVPMRRWLQRNVHAHRLAGYAAVSLSVKLPGQAPGDLTAAQMQAAAALAERFSRSELRISHEQNLLLPWVAQADLPALWQAAREAGLAHANIGLLGDLIACPGGDLCALANARSLPIAAAIQERFEDLDVQHDIGPLPLHISGCINSCGHHHSGAIGILGVDKDGQEWYQLTLGGSDGKLANGPTIGGQVIGPSFSAEEVPDAVEAIVDVYRGQRLYRSGGAENFIDTLRRIGLAPFKAAADAARQAKPTHIAEVNG